MMDFLLKIFVDHFFKAHLVAFSAVDMSNYKILVNLLPTCKPQHFAYKL